MTNDKVFYQTLKRIQKKYPEHYAKSGLCEIIFDGESYAYKPVHLKIADKTDDGNANTRDRYMGILLKEFNNMYEKTENYRILFNKIYDIYGHEEATFFLSHEIIGSIYVHNSVNISTKPYCFAYDFDKLAEHGAFFTDISDRPAQHLDSFIQHVIEFVAVTCRETTGAVGMPALFPYMWYFWDKDKRENYISNPARYLKQQIQMLVYKLNGSEMRMNESAFTNTSCMDESYLEHFFGDRLFPNGEPVIKHISEIVDFEKEFLKCVNDILCHKVMTFPVNTDCLLYDREKSEFVNGKTGKEFSDLNMQWSNSNLYCGDDISTLSTCCRVLNNVDEMNAKQEKLHGFTNFIGGSDLNIGSVGVITMNLPHLAYKAFNSFIFTLKADSWFKIKNCLLDSIAEMTLKTCQYLHCVRAVIQDLIDRKALKIYDLELATIERQFNTVGFIGLYDCARIMGLTESDDILKFEKIVLELITKTTQKFAEDKDYSINVEQIPGESACVKLAQKDKLTFGKDVQLLDCYSNQWIPVSEYRSISDRAEYAAVLDKLCGGGSILHINIDAPFTNSEQAWNVLNKTAEMGVIYEAFNTRIDVCEDEHGFYGDTCPLCGKPKAGEATRPVGFITLVKNWIPSRKEEYKTRKWIENKTV